MDDSERWLPHIDRMSQQYNASPYRKTGIPELELVESDTTLPIVEGALIHSMPLPAGQTDKQRDLDWKYLMAQSPAASLQTVLLPAPPINETEAATLRDVLTDLSMQLQ